MKFVGMVLALFLSTVSSSYRVHAQDPVWSKVAFEPMETTDRFGRKIRFYLSREKATGEMPVVLWIQGSGCQSLFNSRNGQIFGSYQNILRSVSLGRVRILAVEKPGVEPLSEAVRPGSAEGATESFCEEHTLPRWAEANAAALKAVWDMPGVNKQKTLLIGHSEGAIVAARIAAELPSVTHIACMAGGGPNQLFDLEATQRTPRPGDQPGDADARVDSIREGWLQVQKDPESTKAMWLGHPHRRWTSFLSTSLIDEINRSKAMVYVVQGDRDQNSSILSFDIARERLEGKREGAFFHRVLEGDHAFQTPNSTSPIEGMETQFKQTLDWFLK